MPVAPLCFFSYLLFISPVVLPRCLYVLLCGVVSGSEWRVTMSRYVFLLDCCKL